MNRSEFYQRLKEHNIPNVRVSFDGKTVSECYCVRKAYYRWEVYFHERGAEMECVGFPSESDALEYLLSVLLAEHRI